MSEVLLIFIGLSIFNVMLSTVKSILTVKGGKLIAAITSGAYYGFYNIMIIFTVMDFPMWQKVAITFGCNVVGVYIVKLIEEKMQQDKLWKIEFTVPTISHETVDRKLKSLDISTSYLIINEKHTLFNCYCATQAESQKVQTVVKEYCAKWFVSESKNLFQ